MGGKIAGPHQNGAQLANPPRGTQHPQFGVLLQSVTGLDLDHSHAFCNHRIDIGQRRRNQIVFMSLARRGHG